MEVVAAVRLDNDPSFRAQRKRSFVQHLAQTTGHSGRSENRPSFST
jgi:hypothetical protein